MDLSQPPPPGVLPRGDRWESQPDVCEPFPLRDTGDTMVFLALVSGGLLDAGMWVP
ncbi:hypothetical protein WDH52_17180 [Streptomyces sp. TRM70308]|uniref:hypothetical protein n=1 Tax=Streptomyces sp. TRM70308 TaxID=3131932 RepID=UPI003D002F73